MVFDGTICWCLQRSPSWFASRRFRADAVVWFSLGVSLLAASANAQNRVNVTVDLSKPVNILTDTSLGVAAPTFDGNSFHPAGAPFLRAAGITTVRYPGNHGVADLYHWSTKTTTKYKAAGVAYFAPESNFASFAQYAEKVGQAVIVVNYGANLDGSGGGEPAEAAAWVAYANGDAADTRALGKDSTGEDWHTVGFWAALRGQEAQAQDDGFNFLRIHHPKPFGFKLWQIGDEVYNNGYYFSVAPGQHDANYAGEHTGNADLHTEPPATIKDFARLKGDPKLSPAAYAENVKLFAKAMKTVDPAIQIGAAFVTPLDHEKADWEVPPWAPDWNSKILKSACGSIDFVAMEWLTGGTLAPDYKILDAEEALAKNSFHIGEIIQKLLSDYKRDCPGDHVPKISFAPAAFLSWPKIENPAMTALWIADTYGLLIESGTANITWAETYSDAMMSADRKKFGPAYYGFQMLHILARNPGDAFVDASSHTPVVSVHATKRRDGYLGLMLVNKDPKVAAVVKVTFKGGSVGAAGKRFEYGSTQVAAGAPLSQAPFTEGAEEFSITVPPYSITDVLLPDHK